MKLTRRRLVEQAVLTGLAVTRVEDVANWLAGRRTRARGAPGRPEQHVLRSAKILVHEGVEVVVPPLHHRVITARLRVGQDPASLRDARVAFERALADVEAAGPVVTVAWGLPYFRRFVAAQARRELPLDRRATRVRGRRLHVLEDAERFPSDP